MNTILQLIQNHQAFASLAAFWVFSALVSGMPTPTATSSVGYLWLFQSLHFASSNLNAVFSKKVASGELAALEKTPDLPPNVIPIVEQLVTTPAVPAVVEVKPEEKQ